jgi:hypothetical protein
MFFLVTKLVSCFILNIFNQVFNTYTLGKIIFKTIILQLTYFDR